MSVLSSTSTITSDGSPSAQQEESARIKGSSSDETGSSPNEAGISCDVDSESSWTDLKRSAKDEKIFVTVRLRPLNSNEMANHDRSIWECTNSKTVTCLYSRPDRLSFPQSYVFDQVFKAETTTEDVYERGAKDVAMSALTGKNATIFAYGQTCSGKTYTMNGIMELAANDIFSYIKQHEGYIFLLKFAALEIYNEAVSDLLNPDSGPLRIMDYPERGTFIERLTEEIITDKDHLCSLLAVCEAHRQVGETALNDISSRSHQIIRLTIESSPRATPDPQPAKSLIAVLNFVDLAGSERVSLTHSEGTTLKEGCYINRSLLTLSTVIRKLSDPNRSKATHIPYRESKLTRILSNALGGNARTAIICTMSPAKRHLEQTRNTLLFATYATEVKNRVQVNVVISDKDLIKQLKKEVALLETQLRRSSISSQNSYDALLREKELQIQRMQDEMGKAFQERDSARSELSDFRRRMEEATKAQAPSHNVIDLPLPANQNSLSFGRKFSLDSNGHQRKLWDKTHLNHVNGDLQQQFDDLKECIPEREMTSASAVLLEEIYKLEHLQNELAQDANWALEAVQKEVECLCLTQTDMNQEAAMSVAKLQSEIHEIYESRSMGAAAKGFSFGKEKPKFSLKEEIQRVAKQVAKVGDDDTIEKMLANMQIHTGGFGVPSSQQSEANANSNEGINAQKDEGLQVLSITDSQIDTHTSSQTEESIRSVYAYVTEMKERISKLQYQKQLLVHRVLELERSGGGNTDDEAANMIICAPTSPERWSTEFHAKQKQIFELWDTCHVSIIHRSQFYLLFRGDPADAIYIEVELRRLNWLKGQHGTANANGNLVRSGDEQALSTTSSIRALKRERQALVKHLNTRLTLDEREELYREWHIALHSKQRRVKLANMVWTNPQDELHVTMSAELVARLVALWNRSGPVSKEMFQLSLSPPTNNLRKRFSWGGLF